MKTMFRCAIFLCLMILLPAQVPKANGQPLFETRGVWFATVLGDGNWPESAVSSAEKQEADLRNRIRVAAAQGINVFIFQAVSRGDAMYPSERLPWSARLRGPGEDPGYDPLAVAIDEAHTLGIELHAWINTHFVGTESIPDLYQDVTDPAHVTVAHPEWTQEWNDWLWLDPASVEGREWLVGNVMEIVENYDVDAVHFDYMRYPTSGLRNDLANCEFDFGGPCPDVDAWRRANISAFVKEIYPRVMAIKPWVKVGSAPIGNYQNNGMWSALWAYSDVFQESRTWMPAYHDYVAAQLYWDIGSAGGSPDFAWLANDWVRETDGPVYTGMATYREAFNEFASGEIARQIELSREVGADGHVHFRYDHFLQVRPTLSEVYAGRSLPARMTHRFEIQPPTVPVGLDARLVGPSTVELTWEASTGSAQDPLRAYAIFRREGGPPDVSSAADLFATVGGRSFSEGFTEQPGADVYYRVAALSRLGEMSDGSEAVVAPAVEVSIGGEPEFDFRILSIYPNPTGASATLSFEVDGTEHVLVRVYDMLGREVARVRDETMSPGRHDVSVDLSSEAAGIYIVEIHAGDGRVVRQIVKR